MADQDEHMSETNGTSSSSSSSSLMNDTMVDEDYEEADESTSTSTTRTVRPSAPLDESTKQEVVSVSSLIDEIDVCKQ